MNLVIFFGPPGCGKGTQSDFLRDRLNYKKTSTGDALRTIGKEKSKLGVSVKELMSLGQLIPDDTVSEVVVKSMDDVNDYQGVILDGFPRTLTQVEFLHDYLLNEGSDMFTKVKVIEIIVPDCFLVDRICGRFVCVNCGATYHENFRPTKISGVCDACSGKNFNRRDDDNEDVVKNRLKSYHDNFLAIKEFYDARGLISEIDGTKSIDEVKEEVVRVALD